uniref:Uncharacterized protein n=1 Tax=Moniliophthora roreri TaxID=221103 RepID=A0A0W0FNV1_MONRR
MLTKYLAQLHSLVILTARFINIIILAQMKSSVICVYLCHKLQSASRTVTDTFVIPLTG